MRYRLLLFAALLIGAEASQAAERSTGPMSGAGTDSCADFAARYSRNPGLVEAAYFSWAQGFMAGINVVKAPNFRDVNAVPIEEQKTRLRRYCDQHPLADYWEAVIDLYGSLPWPSAAAK